MPYVSRNGDGAISGLFEVAQQGSAEEFLPADDPRVIAYRSGAPKVTAVSSRQFKLQLLSAGLLDAVDAWVATQPRDVQIAYEYSGTFVKDSPMMTAGFVAMGFSAPEIDAFFEAAARL